MRMFEYVDETVTKCNSLKSFSSLNLIQHYTAIEIEGLKVRNRVRSRNGVILRMQYLQGIAAFCR